MVKEFRTSMMIIKGKIVEAKAHIDCPYCGKVCEFDYEEINKIQKDLQLSGLNKKMDYKTLNEVLKRFLDVKTIEIESIFSTGKNNLSLFLYSISMYPHSMSFFIFFDTFVSSMPNISAKNLFLA